MGTLFLLGPSEWDAERGGAGPTTPMRVRRDLALTLAASGHVVILMEDEKEEPGEDMVQKFERLLGRATDVLFYWPPLAKMATTYDEMLLLRKAADKGTLPRLWFLHHDTVASIAHGEFKILERGGRSRYLTSLARLGITAVPWTTEKELHERAALLAAEMG